MLIGSIWSNNGEGWITYTRHTFLTQLYKRNKIAAYDTYEVQIQSTDEERHKQNT